MWRVQIKDRAQPFGIRNDPTIMRHLHDLSALHNQIQTDNFVNMLQKSFNNDLGRSGSSRDIDLITSLNNTFDSLKNDKIYKKEYENFVDNMCYGKDNEIINFNTALNDFKEIKEFAVEKINTLENSIDNKDLDFDIEIVPLKVNAELFSDRLPRNLQWRHSVLHRRPDSVSILIMRQSGRELVWWSAVQATQVKTASKYMAATTSHAKYGIC